nr:sulfatase-like hydrolase/transferase [Actinomycetota bacterium]
MSTTRRWFERGGTRFSNAFATWPLCCPSRASILTGRYAHNHGVMSGDTAASVDPTTLIQRHLKTAGYLTAMVGKYFRGWNLRRKPPGFAHWAVCWPCRYFHPRFGVNGRTRSPNRYITSLHPCPY